MLNRIWSEAKAVARGVPRGMLMLAATMAGVAIVAMALDAAAPAYSERWKNLFRVR